MPMHIIFLTSENGLYKMAAAFPVQFCSRAKICNCLATWETAAVLVSYNCRNAKQLQL